jgi:hypothetical protein
VPITAIGDATSCRRSVEFYDLILQSCCVVVPHNFGCVLNIGENDETASLYNKLGSVIRQNLQNRMHTVKNY